MGTFLRTYCYALALGACGIGFLIWVLYRSAEREGEDARFGVSDHLLLWPLLLTKRKDGKAVRRGLTRRELIGWTLVAIIMLLAVLLTPSRR